MSNNIIAEELKKSGNQAFGAKRYEDAIVLYDKAIEAEPTNYVYWNNRSAANHELKRYDEAIADANSAIAIQNNAKSHYRVGASMWASDKLPEARAAFEKALGLEPSNSNAKESISLIDRAMSNFVRSGGIPGGVTPDGTTIPGPIGGEFDTVRSGPAGVILDAIVIATFAAFVLSSFVSKPQAKMIWGVFMSMTMAQQFLVMRMNGLVAFDKEVLGRWFSTYSSLTFILCFFALLTGIGPQLLMGGIIAMYTVLGLALRRDTLRGALGPIEPFLMPQLDNLGINYEEYVLKVSSFEALYAFVIPLSGGTWFTLAYIQYAINRYKSDRYVQTAFGSLRRNTATTMRRFLPAACERYFQKFCDLIFLMTKQSL